MDTTTASEQIDHSRRRLFGAAAVAIAAAQFSMVGSAVAQPGKTKLPAIKPGANTSFATLKQIDAGLLNVGYAEAGPANGPAVILLHGWPYDIHSYVDVAPLLASVGYRVSSPMCAAAVRRVSFQVQRSGMANRRRWPSIRSL